MLTDLRCPRGEGLPLSLWREGSNEEIIMSTCQDFMVLPARRNAALLPSMRVRIQHVLQTDMTQLNLRRSIRDALNPIREMREGEKERERERERERDMGGKIR